MLMGSAMGWMGNSEESGEHVTRFLNFFLLVRVAKLFKQFISFYYGVLF